ncbi:hypothetical protein NQ317_014207 [Molorchus minor]|uniref:Uncharacterized protein n=1 Tax=Molorchus minor TaxID=1323400 RepID=A0ABQ9JG43_9CUCU|nr:hypothetical protein NQ317_014207 [Molorchus minor]
MVRLFKYLPMATENKAFYDAVTCVLSCALQADSEIQRLAEERKKALEMVDEYPFILVEIIGSSEEALAEKHMASIFLKNYFHDIFMGKTESQIFKSPITLCRLCLGLVDLLRLNFVSIKTMVCKSLSYIAFKGFWGIIDHKIFPMLKSENEEQVYNAVFFLKQCMNYDEFKIGGPLKTNPEYFEVLLTIFQRMLLPQV